MSSRWAPQTIESRNYGHFQIIFTAPGQPPTDVTYFRNVPAEISSYSSADPFGDSTAVITFGQITAFDDFNSPEFNWLAPFANVDIYWVFDSPELSTAHIDAHAQYQVSGTVDPAILDRLKNASANKQIVFEGFIAQPSLAQDEASSTYQVQVQGALFQVDKYVQLPTYPPQPIPYELVMRDEVFSKTRRPNLRTKNLKIEFPSGWSVKAPAVQGNAFDIMGLAPGDNYTGFSTRQTGSADRSLTAFTNDLLAVMFTNDTGDQWTIRQDTGRQPVLYVRQAQAQADYTVYAGQPGVVINISQDFTQYANVIYGEGTDYDGTAWKNQVVSNDGSRTDYNALAWSDDVHPYYQNDHFNSGHLRAETYLKYNTIAENDAAKSALRTLQRDLDPGWAGSVTLSIDPLEGSRYLLRAGTNLNIKHLLGSGETGMTFHVASCEVDPPNGTVELTVDTKYRDLLTIEEVLTRQRDVLTPSKMLKTNQRGAILEDQQGPWSYSNGSGFIPYAAKDLLGPALPSSVQFPWYSWTQQYPPSQYPGFYIQCNAQSDTPDKRWSFASDPLAINPNLVDPLQVGTRPLDGTSGYAHNILLSEKGTIRLTEIMCVYADGTPAYQPFFCGVYRRQVGKGDMPRQADVAPGYYYPWFPEAFFNTDIYGGTPTADPFGVFGAWQGTSDIIVGWGGPSEPAGYSPGSHASGGGVTGALIDEGTWDYDTRSTNPNYKFTDLTDPTNPHPYTSEPIQALTQWIVFYADTYSNPWGSQFNTGKPVWFIGRFYRQEPGTQ